MADLVYNTAKAEMWDGTVDLLTDTIELMLVTSSYVANADDDVVDAAGANDPIDHELSGTGYVAGHANSGRKTLASKTITTDKTNDRAEFDCADIQWASIDAGTADMALLIKRGASDDTTARLIARIDSGGFPKTTNGGNLDFTVNAEGLLQLA